MFPSPIFYASEYVCLPLLPSASQYILFRINDEILKEFNYNEIIVKITLMGCGFIEYLVQELLF